MFEQLKVWARHLFDRVVGREPRYRVARVASRPRWRTGLTVYVVGEPGHEWCAVFTCPCGCRQEVVLNLLGDVRPRWEVRKSPRLEVSIRPSVRRTRGCRSHFFIWKGQIEWCRGTG